MGRGLTVIALLLAGILLTKGLALDSEDIQDLERELVDLELKEAKRAIDADCFDSMGDTTCKKFRRMGLCHKDYRLKKICRETCGFCGRMPTVPHCAKTQLGCCWDNKTPKKDQAGTNCPKCRDRRDQGRICKMFYDDCNSSKDAGIYMRKVCPETCGVCGSETVCRDNPEQEFFCPDWRKQGMCTSDHAMMSVYCRKTCNLCF